MIIVNTIATCIEIVYNIKKSVKGNMEQQFPIFG